MNSPNRIIPVLLATGVMTLIAVFPVLNLINLFCCAGIITGGFAGVYYYQRQLQNTGIALTSKDGGMIGILSGILSAVFVTGFGLLLSLFSESNPIVEVMKTFDEIGVQTPPEVSQYIDKFSEEYNRYGFSPSITIFSLISNLILYPLFGAAGALLAVNIINRKKLLRSEFNKFSKIVKINKNKFH